MLAQNSELKQYHSFAADYWLKEGNNRERLYHLVHSGRVKEAEMMVASKGLELLTSPDKDLYDLVSVITAPAERMRPGYTPHRGRRHAGRCNSTRRWHRQTS